MNQWRQRSCTARQNGWGIWLYNVGIRQGSSDFLSFQWRLQDLRSTRLEAFAVDGAIRLWCSGPRPQGADCLRYESIESSAPNHPLTCLLAPRSFPGVDGRMFVQNTVVNIGSFHIAPTQPIAVIARKIKHKHIQKESTFPLPLITSLRPPLGGLSL